MAARSEGNSGWVPLLNYALKTGISLSTLRRHIKAQKIKFRVENGRYLLWDEETFVSELDASPPEVSKLQTDLQKAKEEIAELKTLIALYEESLPQKRLQY